jgi:hypothetical protein
MKRSGYKTLVGRTEEKEHYENLNSSGSITLEFMLKKQDEKVWTQSTCLSIETTCG